MDSSDLLLLCATAGEAGALEDPADSLAAVPHRLVLTGIGPVNTAHALTRAVEGARPAAVLQFGIGGAYVAGRAGGGVAGRGQRGDLRRPGGADACGLAAGGPDRDPGRPRGRAGGGAPLQPLPPRRGARPAGPGPAPGPAGDAGDGRCGRGGGRAGAGAGGGTGRAVPDALAGDGGACRGGRAVPAQRGLVREYGGGGGGARLRPLPPPLPGGTGDQQPGGGPRPGAVADRPRGAHRAGGRAAPGGRAPAVVEGVVPSESS